MGTGSSPSTAAAWKIANLWGNRELTEGNEANEWNATEGGDGKIMRKKRWAPDQKNKEFYDGLHGFHG
jgi:hypothetical protein